MKAKTKLIVLISLIVIGVAIMLWGNYIMMNYENFKEVWRAARHEALPQFIIGIGFMVVAYVLTYTKTK